MKKTILRLTMIFLSIIILITGIYFFNQGSITGNAIIENIQNANLTIFLSSIGLLLIISSIKER